MCLYLEALQGVSKESEVPARHHRNSDYLTEKKDNYNKHLINRCLFLFLSIILSS